MSNSPNTMIRFSFARLCALAVIAACPWPAFASLADEGRARLDALFDEQLDYINHQGGPYTDPEDVLRRTRSIFYSEDTPMACPDCPRAMGTSEEEEAAVLRAMQAEVLEGKPRAQFQLGIRCLEGRGVPLDIPMGLRWLQTAADNGVGGATFALAQMYDGGVNAPIDQQKAARLYERAVGDRAYGRFARRRLGEMNEFGIGVPKDYGRAMALYQAEIAPPENAPNLARWSQWSEFAIGRMYAQGKGVPQDYAKAADWFLTAVDRGTGYGGLVPDAECALAIMYWTGLGLRRDEVRAKFFLHRPNALGMKACQKLQADLPPR